MTQIGVADAGQAPSWRNCFALGQSVSGFGPTGAVPSGICPERRRKSLQFGVPRRHFAVRTKRIRCSVITSELPPTHWNGFAKRRPKPPKGGKTPENLQNSLIFSLNRSEFRPQFSSELRGR
jgi:hypothetical protein